MLSSHCDTLPKTNSSTLENGWLEDWLPFRVKGLFSEAFAVSFKEGVFHALTSSTSTVSYSTRRKHPSRWIPQVWTWTSQFHPEKIHQNPPNSWNHWVIGFWFQYFQLSIQLIQHHAIQSLGQSCKRSPRPTLKIAPLSVRHGHNASYIPYQCLDVIQGLP